MDRRADHNVVRSPPADPHARRDRALRLARRRAVARPAPYAASRPRRRRTIPWQWLEDVEGARALQWVHEQNDKTLARYAADPLYKTLYPEALAVLDSQSRVPDIAQRGDYVYNLWQDKTHPRGLYRRATAASFRDGAPQWQPVLDVDALSARENKPWAFGGITCLSPTYVHCLVSLAPGGGDAVERREFNAETLSFVDGGFFVPTAKSRADWVDQDTLYVGTDFGAGTLTESGYPRAAKLWKRGTPLAGARTIFETAATSVGAAGAPHPHGRRRHRSRRPNSSRPGGLTSSRSSAAI